MIPLRCATWMASANVATRAAASPAGSGAARPGGVERGGRGKQRADLGLEGAQSLPASAHLRQQFGARAADLFGAAARVEEFLKQFLHLGIGGHDRVPSSKWPWAMVQ